MYELFLQWYFFLIFVSSFKEFFILKRIMYSGPDNLIYCAPKDCCNYRNPVTFTWHCMDVLICQRVTESCFHETQPHLEVVGFFYRWLIL